MAKTKADTRNAGLDIGLAFIRYATGKESLHYGLWDAGQEVTLANLAPAQDAYTDALLAWLPAETGLRILDIGGGAGETAKALKARGHDVQIVIPSAFLAERCRENAGPDVRVHEMTFEAFESEERFDVCLFSESFQYIPLDASLPKAKGLLAENGVILICDSFRSQAFYDDVGAGRRIGGGHALTAFRAAVQSHDLTVLREEDLTERVAPSIELDRQFYAVIAHAWTVADKQFALGRPLIHRIAHGIFNLLVGKRKRAKILQRFEDDRRTPANFIRYNHYLRVLLKPN